MNRLENIIATIVVLFALIIIFYVFYPQMVFIVSTLNENVNQTGGNYTMVTDHTNRIPGIFGFVMIAFAIALIFSYILNAHREEHEEYEVYQNKYR